MGEDEDFSSSVLRTDFETMCAPLMTKVRAVLDGAVAAAGILVEQIDSVEIVGGSSRVPWVKRMCSEAFGGKELSTTMNADESVARGCALQAAILSPLYKVRDFKVEDTTPFGINVGWLGTAGDADVQDDDGDSQMTVSEGENKCATVFPAEPAPEVVETPEGSPTAEPNGDVPMPDQTDKGEGDGKKEAPAPKEPEKKYEWVDVVKKRKRTKKTDLNVASSGVPGLSADVLQKFMDEETAMQAEMRDIIETDEKRNDLESYIFNMRDKTAESGDYGNFISSTDREKFSEDLT